MSGVLFFTKEGTLYMC